MSKSRVPKIGITMGTKRPKRSDAVQVIDEHHWPYKYCIWYPTPDNEEHKAYGLMAVKLLILRDVRVNKFKVNLVWDYKSDEGPHGKTKCVYGFENDETGEKDAPMYVVDISLERLKKKLAEIGGFYDPEIIDFSICESYEECLEKMMSDDRLKITSVNKFHRRHL